MRSIVLLQTFVQAADRLSLSEAGRDLGVAKSVVSKRLGQLEAECGAMLLVRTTRRVALTPAGAVYLEHARQAIAAMRRAREEVQDLRAELSGLIRVTAPVAWGQRVLGRILPVFLAQHKAVEIDLLLEDRLIDLAQERIDLGLRMTAQAPPDLVAIPLARLDWVICASPAYLAAAGEPEEPAALAGHACLNYWRHMRHNRWDLARGASIVTVQVASRYRANHPEAVADAAVAGLGIALLPAYFVAPELADGRLVRVLPDWTARTEFGDAVTAVALPDRVRFARTQALLGFLRAQLRPG